MINLLKQEAITNGDKLQIIKVERLQSLKEEIKLFVENEDLNGFQKWIVNDMYQFTLPETEFLIKSIIVIAIPHPAYAKVEFTRKGKQYNFLSLAVSDFNNTEKYLNDFLALTDYHFKKATNLPLKRLAVESGLAAYGRNNIGYVDGMGSFFSFAAYFSDILCEKDNWREVHKLDICNNCKICFNNCPTGAILKDRFLIDNEKCLSAFNEVTGDFPDWIPITAHHCLYDCLKCQVKCPMNKPYVDNVIGPIKFSEEETNMLLSGRNYDEFTPELKQKSIILGLEQWLPAIPRNLKVLFESYEQ